jgi:predicted AAA+ superfamily ATPase
MSLVDVLAKHYGVEDYGGPNHENHVGFPQHYFRWAVLGPKNCGKTTKIVHSLINSNIKFDKIYVYAADDQRSKYMPLLEFCIKKAESLGINVSDIIQISNDIDSVISHEHIFQQIRHEPGSDNKDTIIIIDELYPDNFNDLMKHFCHGRHARTSMIYISQNYFQIAKSCRLQMSNTSIFKYPQIKEINKLYSHNGGIPKEQFIQEYTQQTSDPYSTYDF